MLDHFVIFKDVARRLACKRANIRTIFTDSIYPYPKQHFRRLFPSRYHYRETWTKDPCRDFENMIALNTMRVFWTYWWWMLFWHPDKLLGPTHTFPDPSQWTDAELGIPPDEEGTYKDWLKSRGIEDYEPEVPNLVSPWKRPTFPKL